MNLGVLSAVKTGSSAGFSVVQAVACVVALALDKARRTDKTEVTLTRVRSHTPTVYT